MNLKTPLLTKEPHPRAPVRLHRRMRITRCFKQLTAFLAKLFVVGLVTINGEACKVIRSNNFWRPRTPPRTTAPDTDVTHSKSEFDIFTGHVNGRGHGVDNDAPPQPRPSLSTPPPNSLLIPDPPPSPSHSTSSTGLTFNPKRKAGYDRLDDSDVEVDFPPLTPPAKPAAATGKQLPEADFPPAPQLGKAVPPSALNTGAIPKQLKVKVVQDDANIDFSPITIPPIPRNEIVLPPTSPPLWRRALNKGGDFMYQSGIQTLSAGLSSTPFYVMSTLQQPPPQLPPPVTINNQRHYPQVPYPYHVQHKDQLPVPASPQAGTKTLPSYQAQDQVRLGSKPTAVPVVKPAPAIHTATAVRTPPAPTKLPKVLITPTPVPTFYTRTRDTCTRNLKVCQALSMATAALVATAATASIYEISDVDTEDDIQLLAWLYRFLQGIADDTGKSLNDILHIVENFPPERLSQAQIIATSLEEVNSFRKKHHLPLDFEYTDKQANINIKFLDFVQILMATRGRELLSYIQDTMAEMLIHEPHLLKLPQSPTNIPEF